MDFAAFYAEIDAQTAEGLALTSAYVASGLPPLIAPAGTPAWWLERIDNIAAAVRAAHLARKAVRPRYVIHDVMTSRHDVTSVSRHLTSGL